MDTTDSGVGSVDILLISDFPVDDDHLQHVRRLFGEATLAEEIAFAPGRRSCRWPLRVPDSGRAAGSLSTHVYLCAGFLARRGVEVDRLHALGCNLELCFRVPGLAEGFSIAAGTMKQLADLHIQLSFATTTVPRL